MVSTVQAVELKGRASGILWSQRPMPSKQGQILQVTHTRGGTRASDGHLLRFSRLLFDPRGTTLALADQQGNTFLLNLDTNRFAEVARTGNAATAISFCHPSHPSMILASADCTLRLVDTDTGGTVKELPGHSTSVHHISVNSGGTLALTTSGDTALLWDLQRGKRLKTLNGAQDVGVTCAFFIRDTAIMVTVFKDDSIMVWDSQTMGFLFSLSLPPLTEKLHLKTFCVSRDGRYLVGGGRSRKILVWDLQVERLCRVIQLPQEAKGVAKVQSVWGGPEDECHLVGALGYDGIIRFVDIETAQLVRELGTSTGKGFIDRFSICPNGRYLAAVMSSGAVNLYDLDAVLTGSSAVPAAPSSVKGGRRTQHFDVASTAGSVVPSVASHRSTRSHRSAKSQESGVTSVWSKASTYAVPSKKRAQHRLMPRLAPDPVDELPLDREQLQEIVRGFGQFPVKYRQYIWKGLLCLPSNHNAYNSLLAKGTHNAYLRLNERYPIKSRRLQRTLQRTLSCLAHWAPIFGEVDYLPGLVFPFVKYFEHNQVAAFEAVATVLTSWCQLWFEFFPNPPINVLNIVENILAQHDSELLRHFVRQDVTSQLYAWTLLQNLLSEVLTEDEWLVLWDNIFSSHPGFLLYATVAYLMYNRLPLLRCKTARDFDYFFHNRNPVIIQQVVKRAYKLMRHTPSDIDPCAVLSSLEVLPQGTYPLFNKYPAFIVDYQVKERERIREEELEFLRQKAVALESRRQTELMRQEERSWNRQQELLMDAEEQRRQWLRQEEERMTAQRARLLALRREQKVKELQVYEDSRRSFLQRQYQMRQAEVRRLDDELERKRAVREQQTAEAVTEMEEAAVDMATGRGALESRLQRELEVAQRHTQSQVAAKRTQLEGMAARTERREAESREAAKRQVKDAEVELARMQQHNEFLRLQNDLEARFKAEELAHQYEQMEATRRQRLRDAEATARRILERQGTLSERQTLIQDQVDQQGMHRAAAQDLDSQRFSEALGEGQREDHQTRLDRWLNDLEVQANQMERESRFRTFKGSLMQQRLVMEGEQRRREEALHATLDASLPVAEEDLEGPAVAQPGVGGASAVADEAEETEASAGAAGSVTTLDERASSVSRIDSVTGDFNDAAHEERRLFEREEASLMGRVRQIRERVVDASRRMGPQ